MIEIRAIDEAHRPHDESVGIEVKKEHNELQFVLDVQVDEFNEGAGGRRYEKEKGYWSPASKVTMTGLGVEWYVRSKGMHPIIA